MSTQAARFNWAGDLLYPLLRGYLFIALAFGSGILMLSYSDGNDYSIPADAGVTTAQRIGLCVGIGLVWPFIIYDEIN